jgi:hypothetical protein
MRSAASEPVTESFSAFPEGGRDAWTCLLGSFLMMIPSFGFQTAGKTKINFLGQFTKVTDTA